MTNVENKTFLQKILDKKVLILILFGIFIRVFMLIYYYYTHSIYPGRSWGDVGLNFDHNRLYPPFGALILDIFRLLSFNSIEIFAFWSFFLDIGICLMFYYVLKVPFRIPVVEDFTITQTGIIFEEDEFNGDYTATYDWLEDTAETTPDDWTIVDSPTPLILDELDGHEMVVEIEDDCAPEELDNNN